MGPAMSLDAATVHWVAHLARLELTDEELAIMTRQLNSIVEYVDLLKRLDTDGVEPMAHALAVHNVFRLDEPGPSLPVAEALANATDPRKDARGEQFYAVPAVLD
jgi:aspartyl-tRNA(Asn)/glutamyl-tRNA(Gln) amidotransferase subunit C